MSKKTAKTMTSRPPNLVLASSSPYRKLLLERLGLPFRVVQPKLIESPIDGETPAETAVRLAEAKARAVGTSAAHALIIGSDQVADLNGAVVGKPRDHVDAFSQLKQLRGR